MARDFNGSNQYLQGTFVPVSGYPFTMGCWFNTDSDSAGQYLMQLGDISTVTDYCSLNASGTIAGDPVRALSRTTTTLEIATTSTGYSTGTWHHACGVWTNNTLRAAYIDGGGKGTDTDSSVFAGGIDTTAIGRLSRPSPAGYYDGRIAEAGIWNVALSDAEVAVLAEGVSPLLVRPVNLVAYWPIVGRYSPEIDLIGSNNLTVTGATQAAHPRIIYPRCRHIITAPPPAAGGLSIPVAMHHYTKNLGQ